MRDSESGRSEGDQLRVYRTARGRPAWARLVPNDRLHALQAPANRDIWQSAGADARFVVTRQAMGGALAAGWYEVHVRLEVVDGSLVLPSLCTHYVHRSALTDAEWILPSGDGRRRFSLLVVLFEDVDSIEFLPGIGPVRFRIREFTLRRVSRLDAFRTMLARPIRSQWKGCATRAVRWGRVAARRGLKRATDGLLADYRKRMLPVGTGEYDVWVRKYDSFGRTDLDALDQRARELGDRGPLISLLLSARQVPEPLLRRCLDSVLGQAWKRWELCVVVNAPQTDTPATLLAEYASRDQRIRVDCCDGRSPVPGASVTALDLSRGEFIALLDRDAVLRPHALLRVAEIVATAPELAIVYSDEDRIDAAGNRSGPDFKPDWNPDLLCSCDYLGHLTAIRTSVVREVGGLRAEPGASHDRVLRCSERIGPRQVHHIPEILYHACAQPVRRADRAADAADSTVRRIVAEHLERTGSSATVEKYERIPGAVRVRWQLPSPTPKISLVIPTRDRARVLRMCAESILGKSTYPDFELVIVDNGSSDREALDYLRQLGTRDRVRVLRYAAPFNYSAINNWAARQCDGHLLGLINNDVEVISPDWLGEMAGFATRADTGAVGAMLYYPDDTIQHAGMVLGIHGVAAHVYAGMPRGHPGYAGRAQMAQNLSAVTGACLLVRREVFESVGGLDERLPVEFNDIDFCLRVRERGYRNVWTPFAELYHHESASRAVDDGPARQARAAGIAYMLERWGDILRNDPAYNCNLSLQSLEFGLAFPPRKSPSRIGAVRSGPTAGAS